MKTDLFQSCGHYWVFQICWHIECSTFTASSSRIWNSSTGIPSPPLALLIVIQNTRTQLDKRSMYIATSESCSAVSDSLQPYGLYSPWNSPGQNTGVGSLSLLQGIIPIQGSNPGLLHCRQILYQLNHQGSPRILMWVAHPFPKGSFWPRNRTGVSCVAGRFFSSWATRKAHFKSVIKWRCWPGQSRKNK